MGVVVKLSYTLNNEGGELAVGFIAMGICQKLEVSSMVVKIVELACPMSLMHSLTSFIGYLSVWVLVLSPRKF